MSRLVQRVACLTSLCLSLAIPPFGWTTDEEANATWRAAGFLTGLTRLAELALDHVLHVGNVEGDVECLAVLTACGALVCTAAAHAIMERSMKGAGGSGILKRRGTWSAEVCGFEAFEERGGFLQLLPLAGLKRLSALGPREVVKNSRFAAEVNAVRRVAGRPPLKFGSMYELPIGPGMEDVGF